LLALSIRFFLQEAFAFQRRKLALVQMKFSKSSLLLMFLMAKLAALGILGSSSMIFKARSLIFSSKASYSSLFLGFESFNFDISALK
jgi:hypothetical protein